MRDLLLLLGLLSGNLLLAQHCGYDGTSLIVVRPHAANDSTVIPDLRITLLDRTNLPWNFNGRPVPPFIRNNDRTAFDAPGVNHRPRRDEELLFPFAKENYVLVIPRGMDLTGWKVLVQDFNGEPYGACFAQTVVPLDRFDGYPLCGVYDEDVYRDRPDRPSYHPVDIPLDRR